MMPAGYFRERTFAIEFRSKNTGGILIEKNKEAIHPIYRGFLSRGMDPVRAHVREREIFSVGRTLESSGRDFLAERMHAPQSVTNRSFLFCCT